MEHLGRDLFHQQFQAAIILMVFDLQGHRSHSFRQKGVEANIWPTKITTLPAHIFRANLEQVYNMINTVFVLFNLMIPELPFGRLAFARCFLKVSDVPWIYMFWVAAISGPICQVIISRAFPGPQTTRDIKGGLKTVAGDVAENYPHSPW